MTAFAVHAVADVSIQRIDYHNWLGCVRMTNGEVDLIYVPQVGRIMRYGRVGGPNVLWESSRLAGHSSVHAKRGEWANYGGDKLWQSPQSLWVWPPAPILDGAPYEAEVDYKSLVVSGQASAKSGIRFRRRISLDASGTAVHIENEMTNTSNHSETLGVWEITQVNDPDRVYVPLEPTDQMPLGWAEFDEHPVHSEFVSAADGWLVVKRNPREGAKLGTGSSRGVLMAEKAGVRFTITAAKKYGTYPDDGRFLQVYTNGDPDRYVELEVLGPLTQLRPKETAVLNTIWSLQ